ncbi:energy transducer TonB, partial [Bradyrhizobium sp. UFLA 03-164]|nr:energy transducer TonB [Bradyrhizobium uaiense]
MPGAPKPPEAAKSVEPVEVKPVEIKPAEPAPPTAQDNALVPAAIE